MKKAAVLCLLLFSLHRLSAQTAFKPKHVTMTVGYGFPNLYTYFLVSDARRAHDLPGDYSYSTRTAGPVFLKFDYAVTKDIGLGAVLGFSSADLIQTRSYQEKMSGITQHYTDVTTGRTQMLLLGFRFNYHFSVTAKCDPYVGLAVGYNNFLATNAQDSNNPAGPESTLHISFPGPLYMGVTVGARYYVSDYFGLYAEAGLDQWAILQAGFAFKLK